MKQLSLASFVRQLLMCATALILCVIGVKPAWADEPFKEAQDLAFEAQLSAEKSNFEKSIELYKKAYERYPDQEFLFAVASLYRRVKGSCERELSSWERFFAECKTCSLVAKAQERRAEVKQRCLATLEIGCEPRGEVFVQSAPRGRSPQTVTELRPGSYLVECRGRTRVKETVVLAASERKTLKLKEKIVAAPVTPPSSARIGASTAPTNSKNKPAARLLLKRAQPQASSHIYEWSLAAGGLTTMGVAMYLLLHQLPQELDERDQLESQLMGADLSSGASLYKRAQGLDQEARDTETWGFISLGVSAALIGSSAYLLWSSEAPVARVSLVPGQSAHASLSWTW